MKKSSKMILIILQILLVAAAVAYLKLSNEIVNVKYSEKGGTYFYSDGTVEETPNIYYHRKFDNYFAEYYGKELVNIQVGSFQDDDKYIVLQTTKWNLLFSANTRETIPLTNSYKEVPKIRTIYYYNGDMTPEELMTAASPLYLNDLVSLKMFQDQLSGNSKQSLAE